jgi:hypothetical protein
MVKETVQDTPKVLTIMNKNVKNNSNRYSKNAEKIRNIRQKRFDSYNLNRTSIGNIDHIISQDYRQRSIFKNSNILSLKENLNNSAISDNSFKSENIIKDINSNFEFNFNNEDNVILKNKSENIDSGRLVDSILDLINDKYISRSFQKIKLEEIMISNHLVKKPIS